MISILRNPNQCANIFSTPKETPFNKICLNERLLPKYTVFYIHLHKTNN